jgi:hypothetical protein
MLVSTIPTTDADPEPSSMISGSAFPAAWGGGSFISVSATQWVTICHVKAPPEFARCGLVKCRSVGGYNRAQATGD